MKTITRKISFLLYVLPAILILLGGQTAHAQRKAKKDTLSVLREFVNASNACKQFPMMLAMEVRNSTNFLTTESDTAIAEAEFYLQKEQSYVRFGEFEQLVNDSMALLISNNLERMILYPDAAAVVTKMKNMLGAMLPDSSLRNLAARYTSVITPQPDGHSKIELTSRFLLPHTSLAKETIEMQYDPQTKRPSQVITLRRTLLPVDPQVIKDRNDLIEKSIIVEGRTYVIKEQVTAFVYTKFSSGAASVPVSIADRIARTIEGYKPVGKYENYLLTQAE
jgi:hypothetical protein